MPYNMTISPDFKPDLISGWYIFNTWLQKKLGEDIHLEMVNDFTELEQLIEADKVELIYANPFDMTKLIREKSFIPVARPVGKVDEAVIIIKSDSDINVVESLKPGVTVSVTDAPDVNMVGAIMLESADIYPDDINRIKCSNYITVAKNVINGTSQIGFILADAYDELSSLVKKQIRPLIRSKIHMLHHTFLISPNLAGKKNDILNALISLSKDDRGQQLLKSLELEKWESIENEDAEFMIDLMDTLQPN